MITAPLSSQLAREEAARRRQSLGFWAGIMIGFALGCMAAAVAA
jgi:hypothetical protein